MADCRFALGVLLLVAALSASADEGGRSNVWSCEIRAPELKLTSCELRDIRHARDGKAVMLNADRGFVRNSRGFAEAAFEAPSEGWYEVTVSGCSNGRTPLEIWVNDRSRQPDTLHLYVNYRKTDSLGKLVPELEHVKLYYQAEESGNGSSGSSSKTVSKSSKKDLKHEDTICVYKLVAEPERVEQYGYELEFTYPIITEGFDSLKFKSINPKQQESPAEFTVIKDTNNLRKFTIMPKEKLMPGYDYVLKMPYRMFRDINGYYNDSTEVKVTLPSDEKLSTLNLILTGVENKYIVDLLNEKRDKVLRQYVIDSDRTLAFPYLKAGKYSIRITEDVNANSIVDTGSILDHRQPEKVLFFKIKDDSRIDIPEMVEIDQEINLHELFAN